MPDPEVLLTLHFHFEEHLRNGVLWRMTLYDRINNRSFFQILREPGILNGDLRITPFPERQQDPSGANVEW